MGCREKLPRSRRYGVPPDRAAAASQKGRSTAVAGDPEPVLWDARPIPSAYGVRRLTSYGGDARWFGQPPPGLGGRLVVPVLESRRAGRGSCGYPRCSLTGSVRRSCDQPARRLSGGCRSTWTAAWPTPSGRRLRWPDPGWQRNARIAWPDESRVPSEHLTALPPPRSPRLLAALYRTGNRLAGGSRRRQLTPTRRRSKPPRPGLWATWRKRFRGRLAASMQAKCAADE